MLHAITILNNCSFYRLHLLPSNVSRNFLRDHSSIHGISQDADQYDSSLKMKAKGYDEPEHHIRIGLDKFKLL